MIYIIGVLWLVYSCFWFYVLNYTVKNAPESLKEMEDKETVEVYLKYSLLFNLIAAIIAPMVHLWHLFFWIMKTVVFGVIDLISSIVKDFKGNK